MRKIQIIGNVTKDAEVRVIPSGKSVINFDIAINEKFLDKNKVKQERTYYIRCAVWRDNTTIAQYITKGSKMYVEGAPDVDAYINKEGKADGSVKINVREMEFLGGGKKVEGQGTSSTSNETLVPTPDDDLPF